VKDIQAHIKIINLIYSILFEILCLLLLNNPASENILFTTGIIEFRYLYIELFLDYSKILQS
jgi:hypothetical protein